MPSSIQWRASESPLTSGIPCAGTGASSSNGRPTGPARVFAYRDSSESAVSSKRRAARDARAIGHRLYVHARMVHWKPTEMLSHRIGCVRDPGYSGIAPHVEPASGEADFDVASACLNLRRLQLVVGNQATGQEPTSQSRQ